MIDWQKPFETAPRDGRHILAWHEENREAHTIYCSTTTWITENGDWRGVMEGEVIPGDPYPEGYSAWAEINPPEREEQAPVVALTEYKVPGFPEPAESEYYTKVEKLVANEQDARIRSKFMKSGLIEEGKQ